MDDAKLRDIPLFAKLSRKQRKFLALRADEVDVQSGTLVCRKGESANELYVIEQGTAKVVRDDQYLDELGPGDFFGEMGLMADTRRNATVTATSPVKVVVMTAQAFRQTARELPDVADKIRAAIEERCRALEAVS